MKLYSTIDAEARVMYDQLTVTGLPVDRSVLFDKTAIVDEQLETLLNQVEILEGFKANPNGSKDYEKIAVAHGVRLPKTPTGRTKTDEKTIQDLKGLVPALDLLSQGRKIVRRQSLLVTLREALDKNFGESTIHPTYTFYPELARVSQGGEVKPDNWEQDFKEIVRLPGHYIVNVDYNRIEPIVLAYLSGDEVLMRDLQETDPYVELTKQIFGQIDTEKRQTAKVAFLACIYGQTPSGLSFQTGIARSLAHRIHRAIWARYKVAGAFLQSAKAQALRDGFVENINGRRRELDRSKDDEYNERLVGSAIVQNTAADFAKQGFLNVFNDPRRHVNGEECVRLINTVHDCLVLVVKNDFDFEDLVQILTEGLIVCNTELPLPITATISWGQSWADKTGVRKIGHAYPSDGSQPDIIRQ
jgi:DNA polymerase-1